MGLDIIKTSNRIQRPMFWLFDQKEMLSFILPTWQQYIEENKVYNMFTSITYKNVEQTLDHTTLIGCDWPKQRLQIRNENMIASVNINKNENHAYMNHQGNYYQTILVNMFIINYDDILRDLVMLYKFSCFMNHYNDISLTRVINVIFFK